jgi:cation transport ATPase
MRFSEGVRQLEQLLARPPDQRLREYKYRCAQSIVFGLPVIALQYFGTSLGGPEAPRWVAILQALLAGWVMYVGAAGMLFEGAILLRRGSLQTDFLAAALAIAAYVGSVAALLIYLVRGRIVLPFAFHLAVLLVAIWTGLRWAACLYSLRQPDPRGE